MNTEATPISKKSLWAGRIISPLPTLFLLMDGGMKLMKPKVVVDTTVQLGYSESVILPLGVVLLVCTCLYAIPCTSVLGAILLTGYLGGAVATHVRVGADAFPILFPVILGGLISSTLLDFIVTPGVFWTFGKRGAERIATPHHLDRAAEDFSDNVSVEPPTLKGDIAHG